MKKPAYFIWLLLLIYQSAIAEEYEPVIVAGDHHFVKYEDDSIRVLEVVIEPGETVPFHQHTMKSLFVTLEPAALVFRDLGGNIIKRVDRSEFDELPHYDARKGAPAPRSVENVDSVTMKAIRIELK